MALGHGEDQRGVEKREERAEMREEKREESGSRDIM